MKVAATNVEVESEQPLNPLQPVEQVLDERLEDEDEPESAPSLDEPVQEPVSVELQSVPVPEQAVEQPSAQAPVQPVEPVENTESLPAASPVSGESSEPEVAEKEPESDASAVFNSLSPEEKIALLAKLQVSRPKLSSNLLKLSELIAYI